MRVALLVTKMAVSKVGMMVVMMDWLVRLSAHALELE